MADFRNANLNGVTFEGSELHGANFAGQTLTNWSLRAIGLDQVNFTGANLSGADLSRNSAAGTIFANANLSGVNFEGTALRTTMPGYDLRATFLRGIAAGFADWSGINLAGTDLSLSVLGPVLKLNGANFEGANMEGVTFDRYSNSLWQTVTNGNFRNANLRGAVMRLVGFQGCDFTGADLSFADLSGSGFANSVGLNTEQPGMKFDHTTLPDGSLRTGLNPGVGTAPAVVPSKLQFSMEERGIVNLEFEPSGSSGYTGGLVGRFKLSGNDWIGEYEYSSRGRVATLGLSHPDYGTYKLIFTTGTNGQLFKVGNNTGAATFLIGSFIVPE